MTNLVQNSLRWQLLLALSFAAASSGVAAEQLSWPGKTWETAATPADAGWSTHQLNDARQVSETLFTNSVLIVHRGVIVDQWGDVDRKLPCHSMRKSLMSLMIGLCVEAGQLDLASTLEDLDIDDKQALSPSEKQATVADLLKSRSGVYHHSALEPRGMKENRPKRGSHPAGTFWFYNNWDFNALLTIFEQQSGEKFFEAFEERIGRPIGMETFTAKDGRYRYNEASIHPGYMFNMTAPDLARVGLLAARGGRWRDEQLVPSNWIEKSTSPYSDTGAKGWYAYMWYATGPNDSKFAAADVGERAFGASGWGGHWMVVLPESDIVIVHRVNTSIPLRNRIVRDHEFGELLTRILAARPKSN